MVVFALLFIFMAVVTAFSCTKKGEDKKEKKPIVPQRQLQAPEARTPPTPGVTTTPTASNASTPITKPKASKKDSEPLKFDLRSMQTCEQNKTNMETIDDFDNPLMDKRTQAKLRNGSATKSNDSAEKTPDNQEKSLDPTLPSAYDKKESTTLIKNTKYCQVSKYISN